MAVQTEIKTIEVSRKISKNIWNAIEKMKGDKIEGSVYNVAGIAYDNESQIRSEAVSLLSDAKRAITRLEEVIRDVENNNLGCINGCGIMQGLNHDIDTHITKLHLLTENRINYKKYIK